MLIVSIPFLLIAMVAFASVPATNLAGPVATSDPVPFDGSSDYAAHCAKCHGNDGRGQTAKGRQTHAGDLTKSTVSDTKGMRMIANGRGEMPSFSKNLDAGQIQGVMNYIRGFRR